MWKRGLHFPERDTSFPIFHPLPGKMLLGQVAVRRYRAGGADYWKRVKNGHDGRATTGSELLTERLSASGSLTAYSQR